MSFETIKTIVLNVLVFLSIFLTYQLWTIQPDYEQLDNLETVEKVVLGPERKLSSVVQPIQTIFHLEGDHVGAYNLNGFQEIYQLFLSGTYSDVQEQTLDMTRLNQLIEQRQSVEFIFPDGLPMSMFRHMLTIEDEDAFLSEIERIVLFEQTVNDRLNTKVWFISFDQGRYLEAEMKSHSLANFLDLYQQNEASFVNVARKKTDGHQPSLYFPKESIEANVYQAYPSLIEENQLIEALFPDPTVVRQSNRENGIRAYTDGSRELKLLLDADDVTYINPTRGADQRLESESAVLQVFQFVNSHGGFTNPFMLLNVENRNDRLVEIEFHLNFNGYPTFGSSICRLNVVWQDHEVFEYHRSMNVVQDIIYEDSDAVELLPDQEMMKIIGSDLDEIENIMIGYTISEYDEYLLFSPSWYIQHQGVWEALQKEG